MTRTPGRKAHWTLFAAVVALIAAMVPATTATAAGQRLSDPEDGVPPRHFDIKSAELSHSGKRIAVSVRYHDGTDGLRRKAVAAHVELMAGANAYTVAEKGVYTDYGLPGERKVAKARRSFPGANAIRFSFAARAIGNPKAFRWQICSVFERGGCDGGNVTDLSRRLRFERPERGVVFIDYNGEDQGPRPRKIFLTANSGPYLAKLKWTGWGTSRAVGRGVYTSDCASCAPPERRAAKVVLRKVVSCSSPAGREGTKRIYRSGKLTTGADHTGERRTVSFDTHRSLCEESSR